VEPPHHAAECGGQPGDAVHEAVDHETKRSKSCDEGQALERPHDEAGIELVDVAAVGEERLQRSFANRSICGPSLRRAEVADAAITIPIAAASVPDPGEVHVEGVPGGRGHHGLCLKTTAWR
jgi:hypothetical protein